MLADQMWHPGTFCWDYLEGTFCSRNGCVGLTVSPTLCIGMNVHTDALGPQRTLMTIKACEVLTDLGWIRRTIKLCPMATNRCITSSLSIL